MQFASHRFGDIALAVPSGRLDHGAAEGFERALMPLASDASNGGLVLDLADVEYLSSVGLRVLMLAAKAARGRKARIAAAALQPLVAEIFAISRFDSVFEIFPSVPAALSAMSPDAYTAYEASSAARR